MDKEILNHSIQKSNELIDILEGYIEGMWVITEKDCGEKEICHKMNQRIQSLRYALKQIKGQTDTL